MSESTRDLEATMADDQEVCVRPAATDTRGQLPAQMWTAGPGREGVDRRSSRWRIARGSIEMTGVVEGRYATSAAETGGGGSG